MPHRRAGREPARHGQYGTRRRRRRHNWGVPPDTLRIASFLRPGNADADGRVDLRSSTAGRLPESVGTEGATGLRSLGVRELTYKLSFLACTVQPADSKVRPPAPMQVLGGASADVRQRAGEPHTTMRPSSLAARPSARTIWKSRPSRCCSHSRRKSRRSCCRCATRPTCTAASRRPSLRPFSVAPCVQSRGMQCRV